MAVAFHPASYFSPVAVFSITLDLTADVDLTLVAGQTLGWCPRALLVGSTAGNIKYKDLAGNIVTQAVAANQRLDGGVSYVYSSANGTTAATVTAEG